MINFGTVRPGTTLYIPFDSFAGSTGASSTISGLAVTDIEIYKNGSVTQRSSDNGYTLLDTDGIDFDGITGINGFSISLADNSDAGFYAAGADYFLVVSTITVDSQTVSFVAARWTIGYENAVLNTTIATLSSQTSFTLTAGPAEDDALNGMEVIIHDVASAVQLGRAVILDYTGSTKTVTLAAGTTFTAAASDNISVMGPSPLMPTVTGRTLDVTSTGAAGVDWGNVENPTTTVGLTNTTIAATQQVDVNTIKTQAVTCAAGVTILASVGTASTSTAQTGDSYAIVNSGTFGNSALNNKLITLTSVLVSSSDGSVNDVAATTTSFKTTLSAVDDFYNDSLIVFTSGALAGQSRPILDYAQTNGVITLDEALTSAPANGVTFLIQNTHIHPVSQIAAGVWQDTTASHFTTASSIGKSLYTSGATPGAAGGFFIAGLNAATTANITGNITGNLSGSVGSVVGDVGGNVVGTVAGVTPATTAGILTTALTEAYAADGAAFTLSQGLYMIWSLLAERSIASTTLTAKKLDGSATAMTFTLDSATTPTSQTRAT